MKNLQKYERSFSRDFSLPSVEAWVRGETTNPKQWTTKKQPFLPYIVTHRADDTVHFYYNLQGVEWVQDLLVKMARNDKDFLARVEKTVLQKLTYIRPIYEKQKTLSLDQLKRFLRELEDGYPWFEAMWWFCQMDEKKLVGLHLEKIQEVRELTDVLCNSSDTVIRKSLARLYPALGDLSSVLSTKEIISKIHPQKEALKQRYDGYFFTNNQLFTGIDITMLAKKLHIHIEQEKIKKMSKLTGDIANKGFVKGKVRRVMGHKQIHEVKTGEILVSPMTIPDFLPAMVKAAAYVTDEGGILCHAAIVAREFNKPCIVGTKFATKIFHNGDLVEVDANKGIVTLLNKGR